MIYDDEPSFPTSLKADITMWAFTALEVSVIGTSGIIIADNLIFLYSS